MTTQDVEKSFRTILLYCKEKELTNASCLGCPIRKSFGTKQPDCCRLNMIGRPSDIDIEVIK